MLRLYISDKRHRKPCFVTGGFGRGRGYWVRAVLHEYGFEPVWLYESVAVNTTDLDGRKLFPVYDVAVLPPKLPTERCIVLMDDPPTDKRDGIVVAFPPPSRQDLMAFVRANGQPESLANGCATYDDAVAAVRVYDASGVALQSVPVEMETWDAFVRGGPAPVEPPFFPYWAAYHQPPRDWTWNQILYLQRYIPARIAERMVDAIRLTWAAGPTIFPSLLRQRRGVKPPPAESKAEATPAAEKSYSATW